MTTSPENKMDWLHKYAVLLTVLFCGPNLAGAGFEPQNFADSLLLEATERIVPAGKYVWNWRDAIVVKALVEASDLRPDLKQPVADYVEQAMRSTMDGSFGLHPNAVASGVGLAFLMRAGRDTDGTFARAAERLYAHYRRIPRLASGATSHRPGRIELWDDTVYMLTVFLLEMYRATGDERYLDDCIREIFAHAEHLRDSRGGLWYHGWSVTSSFFEDGCCEYMWNSNQLQRNTEFWGRGNGWIAMSLADVLAVMPGERDEYRDLERMFRQMMATLCRLQQRENGHWLQLPARTDDRGRGNYIESSGTAMFGYALARGVESGILRGSRYRRAARNAWRGLLAYSLKGRGTDRLTLGNICAGTCIGERDYYYARPVTEDESFAVGAFLLLAYRMESSNGDSHVSINRK